MVERRSSTVRAGFQAIKKEHVEQACRQLASEGVGRGGCSYTVSNDGHELPAKRVLQTAYKIATGAPIDASRFSGGEFTARILRRVGIDVQVRAGASNALAEGVSVGGPEGNPADRFPGSDG